MKCAFADVLYQPINSDMNLPKLMHRIGRSSCVRTPLALGLSHWPQFRGFIVHAQPSMTLLKLLIV